MRLNKEEDMRGSERFAYFKRFEMEDVVINREIPRCISACPAGCDVQGYIKLIAERRYEEAYEKIRETVTLPATIGRICHHPCEDACKRAIHDEPIAIAALKRFAGDAYRAHISERGSTGLRKRGEAINASGKRVAVIGAGPAGLTVAYRLAKRGHSVKIFERLPSAGGMLIAGIPPYRLPRDVLRAEIDDLWRDIDGDVEIEYGVEVDNELFERICEEYDAVFIAVGAHRSRKMGIEGEDLDGVLYGVDFLRDFNLGNFEEDFVGKRVIVVGGGNVAIDVARTSLRLGAREVKIVYRRSRSEMPAREEEIKEAEEEGVKFSYLVNPIRIIGDKRVEKVEMIRMKLGSPDETGRRRPIPVSGSEFFVEADFVIIAIGQESDLSFVEGIVDIEGGFIKTDDNGYTGVRNIFSGGDCVRGPAFAIDAIADGNRAAEAIHNMLTTGEISVSPESVGAVFSGTSVGGMTPVAAMKMPEEAELQMSAEMRLEDEFGVIASGRRREMPAVDANERVRGFAEINLGYSEEDALAEAERCLRCRGCMLSVADAVERRGVGVAESAEIEWALDNVALASGVNKCVECGECTAACPVTAIEPRFSPRRVAGMSLMERAVKMLDEDEIWMCVSCGVCNMLCPFGVDFVGFVQGLHKFAFIVGNVPHYHEHARIAKNAEPAADAGGSASGAAISDERNEEESGGHARFNWLRKSADLKVSDKGDVYYFAGCLSLLSGIYAERDDLRLEEIARAAVRLMNALGVVPAVSDGERCCGHDLIWAGDESRFRELMRANIAAINKSGAKVVVFTCAECLRTFEVDYRKFAAEEGIEMAFKCMHISEFLMENGADLMDKCISERGGPGEIITYHDPCRLRHLRIYEPPRELLRMIPSVDLREMEHHKERGPCCGVSAMLTCGAVARVMQARRLDEAERTGAEKIVVACPKCWIHLDCAASALGRKISVEDMTITIADALLGGDGGESAEEK